MSPGRQITYRWARRIAVSVVGGSVLLFGVALIVLPGPALVVIPVGLAIPGLEFAWARRWLRRVRERSGQMAAWISNGANWLLRRSRGARGRAQDRDAAPARPAEPSSEQR
ncbi:MAG TPA: PGPGW domain-containing protein [Steroidobacteraceae bacterium]|nr:PGPGW domain-containing protein [Steroidobacteraceae bacterium]